MADLLGEARGVATMMGEDGARASAMAEIDAMRRVAEALEGLDDSAASRVLRWACDRFGSRTTVGADPREAESRESSSNAASAGFDELADLFAQAAPDTEADRALVVGYWLQVVHGASEFDAQRVNSELKHLGYPVGNITRAIEKLKPTLVQQTKKTGTSQQARKRFKLTHEGRKQVERMLGRRDS